MSVRGDIANWCVQRLESEVNAFRRVVSVAREEEFNDLALNPPSAAVLITKSEDSGTETPPGETYVYFTVEVWFFTNRFGTTNSGEGVQTGDGVYDLLDEIHAAFKKQIPTGCGESLIFIEADTVDMTDGLLTSFAEYQTAALI